MKKLSQISIFLTCVIITCVVIGQSSFAQSGADDQKTTIRIDATENKDGMIKLFEKRYEVSKMTKEQQKKFIDQAIDSLNINHSQLESLSISIQSYEQSLDRIQKVRKARHQMLLDKGLPSPGWIDDPYMEKLRTQLNSERESAPLFKTIMGDIGNRFGDLWQKEPDMPATVRDLKVYANNPDNGVLNLRFQAPQRGDVNISIIDTRGKEVGKKEIKDFSGDFLGQIEIKKNTRGTLFVTVIQNEDGATRRVVIP